MVVNLKFIYIIPILVIYIQELLEVQLIYMIVIYILIIPILLIIQHILVEVYI